MEEELGKLHAENGRFGVLYEQRWNILVVGFRTGLRSEVLRRLQVDSFSEGVTEKGERMLTVVVGSMKNLPSDLGRADAAMFKQVIVAGPEEKYCAVAAIQRQQALARKAPQSPEEGQNWLFRNCKLNSVRLGVASTTEETYRGVAKWVSGVLGRKVTFKDVARRAAMTRLANASDVPLAEVAKYFGVHTNTVQIYHQGGRNMAQLAASILSGVKVEQENGVKAEEAEGQQAEPPTKKGMLFSVAKRDTCCLLFEGG